MASGHPDWQRPVTLVATTASGLETYTEGRKDHPASNALFADTGQLSEGFYDFNFVLTSSIKLAGTKRLLIRHRNAANNATLKEWTIAGVGIPGFQFPLKNYYMGSNERMVITNDQQFWGSFYCVIQVIKVA